MIQPKMTAAELAAMPVNTVGTGIAARVLECDRWTITLMAKQKTLPFDFFFSGNRLHISKASILKYLHYEPNGGAA